MTDSTLNTARILVVEDEALVAADIRRRLIGIGHEVSGLAHTPQQAIQLAADLKPDLLLCDIHLKASLDGIDIAQQITTTQNIPVVFLTAYSDAATVSRAKSVATYGFVLKPIETRELEIAIEMALHRFSLDQSKVTPQTSERAALPEDLNGTEQALAAAISTQVTLCYEKKILPPLGDWLERDLIMAALAQAHGVNLQAAELLSMPESTLRRKLLSYENQAGHLSGYQAGIKQCWDAVRAQLPHWIAITRAHEVNPLLRAEQITLRCINEKASTQADGAALMGNSIPTYRRKLQPK